MPETDVLDVLARQRDEVLRVAAAIPAERETFRYAPGRWSVREILGHIGDGERVFGFRAFCFGRGDKNPLPSFDENEYMATSDFHSRRASELADDFARVRDVNVAMLRRLPAERWANVGNASGKDVTVRALAYVMASHVRHHLGVLKERYGVTA